MNFYFWNSFTFILNKLETFILKYAAITILSLWMKFYLSQLKLVRVIQKKYNHILHAHILD